MTVSLVIQDFESLSASGAYGGLRRLSPQTELMLISLYTYASLYRWKNFNGLPLTPEQTDTIDNWTATAQVELMTPVSGMPLGATVPYYGENIPEGFLWCDGATYLREDYPDLYDALHPNLKPNSTTFVTPNMNNRFPRGTNVPAFINGIGGSDSFTLSASNHAPHTHQVNGINAIPVQAGAGAIALTNVAGSFPFPTGSQGNGSAKIHIPKFNQSRFIMAAL